MMRRLTMSLLLTVAVLATAFPALAQQGNPLDKGVFLADIVGWIMAGLAVVLAVSFSIWARRTPRGPMPH
ncbi:MAG: hypothetical protein LC131_17900 [Anaerolineae bacterium]|nr:hypothetical protein [Anaerolineae bacterium]HNS40998.1 hypothetical protein [Promineifilum sp.]